jgi:hypothetical protein
MKFIKKLIFLSFLIGAVGMVVKKVTGGHEEDEWSEHYGHDHSAYEHAPDDTSP